MQTLYLFSLLVLVSLSSFLTEPGICLELIRDAKLAVSGNASELDFHVPLS